MPVTTFRSRLNSSSSIFINRVVSHLPENEETAQSWPPLWSIGVAIAVMLIVPAILYSMAPAGPIREGDTVFGSGRHTVVLAHPTDYQRAGYENTCVLEFRDPLLVMSRPAESPAGPFRAQIQGKTKLEFPFCPPQAEVILKPYHVIQKPDLLTDLKESLTQLFK
jgi:hypothetical protein